ncbi:MAG TPA: hypothetical protein GXZ38_04370 [Spirochaetales bacterium]|jgi:hypothetical protein|nr:hypothetical protein [Spirochaetales bacterium]
MLRSKVEAGEEDKMSVTITLSPTHNLVQAYLSSKFGTENITADRAYFVPDLIKAILEVLAKRSQPTNAISPSNDFFARLSLELNLDRSEGGKFEENQTTLFST